MVANEKTRINYQFISEHAVSASCPVTPLDGSAITVSNDCDWVSSIFAGEANHVVDGMQNTALVFGARLSENPECGNRPIHANNQ